MAEIPPRLQDPSLRFVLLGSSGEALKKPFEEGWPETANYPYTDTRLSSHRGNIGVCGGFGDLLILDSDDLPRWVELGVLDLIPSTLTIESRPGHRQFYVKCPERFPSGGLYDPERTDTKGYYVHIGDAKGTGGQAVAPGSEHPTGSTYQIVVDAPIATVTPELVRSILQKFRQSKKPNHIEQNAARLESMGREARQRRIETDPDRRRRYAEAALQGEVRTLAGTPEGGRNVQLNDSAFALGQFVGAGDLDEGEVIIALSEAAEITGLDYEGIRKTILSGLEAGKKHPREVLKLAHVPITEEPEETTISEDELAAYSLPEGPKFECNLPKDHFIQRFMAYGSDISDAYVEYWFAGGLFALAVVADKKIKVELKQGKIYPNLYISINGKSSLARKSTAVDKTQEMLIVVLPSLLSALVPTEFSPEAFTEHLSEHNHSPWIRDEAAGVLSLMKRDYMRGFKDSLMQLYDASKPYHRKLRTSQRKNVKTDFIVDDPYLNLLWATTDASLGANTEQNDTLSGFIARFLFFFPQGKKTKWLPLEEGTTANSIFEGVVRDQLTGIAAKMAALPGCTALHFSKEAAAYYTEWQRQREEEWTASNDGNAMQIYSRLAPTVTKLAMLFELGNPDFEVSNPIRLEFVKEACRLVDSYFMPTARAVYDLVGANADKNVIDRIIAYLKKHNGKASRNEILRDVKIKSKEFEEYLSTMLESGVVEAKTVKRNGKGRDTLFVFLLDQANIGNVANIANIANIEEIQSTTPENKDGINSMLAMKAMKAMLPIVATTAKKEEEEPQQPTLGRIERETPREGDPGLTKFKQKVRAYSDRRTCVSCGQHFEAPLVVRGMGGYICEPCRRGDEQLTAKLEQAEQQTKLA